MTVVSLALQDLLLSLKAPTPTPLKADALPLSQIGRGETNKLTSGFLMIIFLSETQHNRPLSPESGERSG